MIEFKIRESTLNRYREVVKNYTDFDGMNITEFQQAAKVQSGLFEAMINEGLFKKDKNGVYRAINKDRERALKCTVVDRVIRECCFKKARQNKKNREDRNKAVLSDPVPAPGTMEAEPKQKQSNAAATPVNVEIPFIEDMAFFEDKQNAPFPGNSTKEIFERLKNHYENKPTDLSEFIAIDYLKNNCDFEQICIDYLSGINIDFAYELGPINKYDIILNKPIIEIEKTKL